MQQELTKKHVGRMLKFLNARDSSFFDLDKLDISCGIKDLAPEIQQKHDYKTWILSSGLGYLPTSPKNMLAGCTLAQPSTLAHQKTCWLDDGHRPINTGQISNRALLTKKHVVWMIRRRPGMLATKKHVVWMCVCAASVGIVPAPQKPKRGILTIWNVRLAK